MARVGLTVERLTEAAAELADEVGFENVTVAALARRFGVKDASLYAHLRNAADLRTRIALLAVDEFAERVAAALAGRAGKDALVAYADAYRAFARERPGLYGATQTRIDPPLPAPPPSYARTVGMTYGMLRAYGLDEPDLTDAVRLLRSTFHGFTALEAGGGFAADREVRASWERMVEALHVLLTHWPAAGGAAPTGAASPHRVT
ncbi:WHG domain-containing protein [Streptomyces sp. NBC_01498]|uniref:TetR/AcrR family transcriptional regulator n=1 Tax=Streptomyces sp. NBC_01498 TaxID=2975870 RepID=UPI002E7B7BBD|nr:WHG domain-containing protein [Streptomyces sp. NBC_01498]WTL23373.1 WHG domain-containing protein [Streptomyces sp. NBC_01498]